MPLGPRLWHSYLFKPALHCIWEVSKLSELAQIDPGRLEGLYSLRA